MTIATVIASILICLVLPPVDAAKVLVIPLPLKSHLSLGSQAGQAVLGSGHEVWIMGPAKKREDAVKKGFHYLEYDTSYLEVAEEQSSVFFTAALVDPNAKPSILTMFRLMKEANFQMCNHTLSNKALMKTIQDQNFDIALMGTSLSISCMYLIPYKFDIPYVTYQPVDEPWIAGVTALPSNQPLFMANPPLSNKMIFTERIRNTLTYISVPLAINYMTDGDYASWFAPEKQIKSFYELRSMSMMWLVTLDNTCLDYPRISAPNYRHIGSLTRAEANPLKGELKAFVDGATNGIILITFGTTTSGAETLRHLLPMLRQIAPEIRQRVLIQLSIENHPEDFPSTIRFERWIPQNDILGHSNTVVFVSHGGANGQMEATYHGVPQVCIGIMEEQKYNCRRMAEHHYGIFLSLHTLSAEDLLHALTEITKDPNYKKNVKHCSGIMHNLPQGKQQLAFWVNHVLEFGGDHLRPSSADMPFYSLYMLDILAAVFLLFVLVVGGFLACLKCMCRCAKKITSKVKEDWFPSSVPQTSTQ